MMVSKPLERIHTDVVGLMKCISIGKAKYFKILFDQFSGYSMVGFIFCKTGTGEVVKRKILKLRNLFNEKVEGILGIHRTPVKWIRSDDGGEYIEQKFCDFLHAKGIAHEITTAHIPESNARAQRLNRTLMDMAPTMVLNREAPQNYYGLKLPIQHAIDVIDRLFRAMVIIRNLSG